MKPDVFAVLVGAESTTDMAYITADICGILYPSSIVAGSLVVVHGLRTEPVNWGFGAQQVLIRVHGSLNVQINVSNSDWDTDCGRYCPALMRHISDLSTQRLFAYSDHCVVPQIVGRMQQSAVVWRPVLHCRNSNCSNRVVVDDGVDSDGSW